LEGEALADYCNGVLNQTLSQIILSYQLLSLRHFDTVISNILTQGLPAMQKLVLYDRKAKRENILCRNERCVLLKTRLKIKACRT